jgi:tRNA dimethylallyltransferase
VGKTAAAIRLAESLHTKIISADSRQCYKELNIGVAKPSPEELRAVQHYFINSHSIRQEVNAALFEELALQWTEEIFREPPSPQPQLFLQSGLPPEVRLPTPIMVGGTGLYIKAFTEGLDEIPPIDPGIRQQVQQQYEQSGLAWLQEEIRQRDPAFFAAGEILNPQRGMRALEVMLSTGHSILSYQAKQRRPRPFRIRMIGLLLPKEELHRRINDRVDQMMEQGLLEEVRSLLPFRDHNALQTVGYKEIFGYLDGKCSLDAAITNIKTNTRHYAKRQMTWFRKDPSIEWVDANQPLDAFLAP